MEKDRRGRFVRNRRDRREWFPGTPTLGVQVVDRRGILQRFPENTWVVSVGRFQSLLN
jgi:hypothetical protein